MKWRNQKMKKNKIISIVCAISLSMGLLSGCGNDVQTSSESDKINLRFSFWEPSTGKEMETALAEICDSYEADHPNVEIELLPQAVSGYQDWIKAQMAVNDLPEIEINYAPNLISQYESGAVVNIKDALNAPNPYNNNTIWSETFIDGSLDGAHEYRVEPEFNIPLFRTGIAMFYNKTMYDELGLSIPNNWNEFIENCKKIDEAGEVPIAFMGQKDDALNWLYWELIGGLSLERWLADDKLNYNGDEYLSTNEITKAVATGDYNIATDKAYQEDFEKFIEYVKEYLQYAPNASGLDESAAKTLFLSGKAAHINSGSWDIVGLLNNEEVDFEAAVFPYPHLTKENSEYAGKGISNNCVQTVAITSSVNKQEGAKEAATDFLMYLTAPEQYKKFVDNTIQIPSIKDVDTDPVFDAFMEEGFPLCSLYLYGSDSAGRTMKEVYKAVVAGNNIELNDALFEEIQRSNEAGAQKTMENREWTEENNFKIDSLPIVGGKFQE